MPMVSKRPTISGLPSSFPEAAPRKASARRACTTQSTMFTALLGRVGAAAELARDCVMVSSGRYLCVKTDISSSRHLMSRHLRPLRPPLRNSFSRHAKLLQQRDQAPAFGLGEPTGGDFERLRVLLEDAADVCPAGRRQADDARPAVRVVQLANDQAALLEPIDGG